MNVLATPPLKRAIRFLPACQEMTTGLSCGDPTPGHVVTPPRSPDGREINKNSKTIMGDVPSVGINARAKREEATGPDGRDSEKKGYLI